MAPNGTPEPYLTRALEVLRELAPAWEVEIVPAAGRKREPLTHAVTLSCSSSDGLEATLIHDLNPHGWLARISIRLSLPNVRDDISIYAVSFDAEDSPAEYKALAGFIAAIARDQIEDMERRIDEATKLFVGPLPGSG